MACRINQMCHVPLKWPGSTGADGLALLGEAGDSHAGTPGQPGAPYVLYSTPACIGTPEQPGVPLERPESIGAGGLTLAELVRLMQTPISWLAGSTDRASNSSRLIRLVMARPSRS